MVFDWSRGDHMVVISGPDGSHLFTSAHPPKVGREECGGGTVDVVGIVLLRSLHRGLHGVGYGQKACASSLRAGCAT